MSTSQLSDSNSKINKSSANVSTNQLIPRTLSPAGNSRRTMSPNASQLNLSEEKGKGASSSSSKKDNKSLDVPSSFDSARAPMLSPGADHKDYNRYKYYSALRTGYAHLGIDQPELEPPKHVIDNALFLFQPFGKYLSPTLYNLSLSLE